MRSGSPTEATSAECGHVAGRLRRPPPRRDSRVPSVVVLELNERFELVFQCGQPYEQGLCLARSPGMSPDAWQSWNPIERASNPALFLLPSRNGRAGLVRQLARGLLRHVALVPEEWPTAEQGGARERPARRRDVRSHPAIRTYFSHPPPVQCTPNAPTKLSLTYRPSTTVARETPKVPAAPPGNTSPSSASSVSASSIGPGL